MPRRDPMNRRHGGNVFKHPIEQTITVHCKAVRMIAPSRIKKWAKDPTVSESRLYLVGRRPRLTLETVTQHSDTEAHFALLTPDGRTAVSTTVATLKKLEPREEDSKQWLELVVGGVVQFDDRPSRVLHDPRVSTAGQATGTTVLSKLLDLDVLYVGKSDNPGGVASERLPAHSTLQQILADHFDHAPAYELWVLPLVVSGPETISAVVPSDGDDSQEAIDRHVDAMLAQFEESSVVALAEAALIRYFAPEYNTHYKTTFPQKSHKSYAEVSVLDYNSLGFTLETEELVNVAVGSDSVAAATFHTGSFAMEKPDRRLPLTLGNILAAIGFPVEDPDPDEETDDVQ